MAICHVLVSTFVAGGGFLDGFVRPRRRVDSTFLGVLRHFDGVLEITRDKRMD